MYTYKNLNTGQVVAREDRSVRFDNSPNWALLSQPSSDPTPAPEAPQSPPAEPGPEHVPDELSARAIEVKDVPVPAEPTLIAQRPTRNASRLEWAEYALARGADPARVADMKRDELVAEFGS